MPVVSRLDLAKNRSLSHAADFHHGLLGICGLMLALSFFLGCKGIGKAASRGGSRAAEGAESIGAEVLGNGVEAGVESWENRKERKRRIKEARARWKPRSEKQRSAYENALLARTNRKLDAEDAKVKDVFCGNPEPNLGDLPGRSGGLYLGDPSEVTAECNELMRRVMPSQEVCHLLYEDGEGKELVCFGHDTAKSERECHTMLGFLWFYIRSPELKQACGGILDSLKQTVEMEKERAREREKMRSR